MSPPAPACWASWTVSPAGCASECYTQHNPTLCLFRKSAVMASSGLRPKKTGVGSAAGTARPAAWSRATSATLGAQVSSGLGKGDPGHGRVRTGPKVLLQQPDSLQVLCILLPQSQSYWMLSCPKSMITCPPYILHVRTSWGASQGAQQ